jgi:hypothetical protein
MLLFSNDPKFRRVNKITTDAYLPQINLWVSDYPYLRRDVFMNLTRYMLSRDQPIVDIEDVEDIEDDQAEDQDNYYED